MSLRKSRRRRSLNKKIVRRYVEEPFMQSDIKADFEVQIPKAATVLDETEQDTELQKEAK